VVEYEDTFSGLSAMFGTMGASNVTGVVKWLQKQKDEAKGQRNL
jgi:hypothetical protein